MDGAWSLNHHMMKANYHQKKEKKTRKQNKTKTVVSVMRENFRVEPVYMLGLFVAIASIPLAEVVPLK